MILLTIMLSNTLFKFINHGKSTANISIKAPISQKINKSELIGSERK
jgi:hypothetical protein